MADLTAPDGAVAVVVTFATLFVGFALTGLFYFIRRRKMFPLTGRNPALLGVLWVASVVSGVYFPISGITQVNCTVVALVELNVGFLGVSAMLMRLMRLWFLYYAAEEQVKRHQAKFSGGSSSWFADHRRYTSTKFMMLVLAAVVAVHLIISELAFAFGPTTSTPLMQRCPQLGVALGFTAAFDFIAILMVVATAWRIRHISDGFAIKQELVYTTCAAVFIIPAVVLHELLLTDVAFPVFGFLIGIGSTCEIAIAFYFPLYVSLRHERVQSVKRERMRQAQERSQVESMNRIMVLTLEEILTQEEHGELREDFERYLSKEFSFENLMFWKRAGDFVQSYGDMSDEDVLEFALEIYNGFLRVGAPFEANLSHAIRSVIYEHLFDSVTGYRGNSSQRASRATSPARRIDRDTFDAARDSVYRLMAHDTYVRWQLQVLANPSQFAQRYSTNVSNQSTKERHDTAGNNHDVGNHGVGNHDVGNPDADNRFSPQRSKIPFWLARSQCNFNTANV